VAVRQSFCFVKRSPGRKAGLAALLLKSADLSVDSGTDSGIWCAFDFGNGGFVVFSSAVSAL